MRDSITAEAVTAMEAETGRHIEQSLPPALPLVSGHRERVVLALINVLRNAAQSAPAATPLIRLQAESIDGARAVLVIPIDAARLTELVEAGARDRNAKLKELHAHALLPGLREP